jgi:hypothetical protein
MAFQFTQERRFLPGLEARGFSAGDPMNRILASCLALALSSITWSQEAANQPVLQSGDTWTYRSTTERGPSGWSQVHEDITVTRATGDSIFFSSKTSGSTQPPHEFVVGADWSRMRDVNGKQTVVNRPLAFPLQQGKRWDVAYTEQNPNTQHKSETFETHYSVMAYETVEVPAGKFRALKIEGNGQWHAEIAPQRNVVQGAQSVQGQTTMATQVRSTAERTVSGRLYKAFWYAPEVKRWVKAVEEYYSSGGERNERYTLELESYKTAGAGDQAN